MELYSHTIKNMVFDHVRGLTNSEYEDIRLAMIGMSILVTKFNSLTPGSWTCKDAVHTKILVGPLVDLYTKTSYQLSRNGHMLNNNGRPGTYTVFAWDALIGKQTFLFGQRFKWWDGHANNPIQ